MILKSRLNFFIAVLFELIKTAMNSYSGQYLFGGITVVKGGILN